MKKYSILQVILLLLVTVSVAQAQLIAQGESTTIVKGDITADVTVLDSTEDKVRLEIDGNKVVLDKNTPPLIIGDKQIDVTEISKGKVNLDVKRINVPAPNQDSRQVIFAYDRRGMYAIEGYPGFYVTLEGTFEDESGKVIVYGEEYAVQKGDMFEAGRLTLFVEDFKTFEDSEDFIALRIENFDPPTYGDRQGDTITLGLHEFTHTSSFAGKDIQFDVQELYRDNEGNYVKLRANGAVHTLREQQTGFFSGLEIFVQDIEITSDHPELDGYVVFDLVDYVEPTAQQVTLELGKPIDHSIDLSPKLVGTPIVDFEVRNIYAFQGDLYADIIFSGIEKTIRQSQVFHPTIKGSTDEDGNYIRIENNVGIEAYVADVTKDAVILEFDINRVGRHEEFTVELSPNPELFVFQGQEYAVTTVKPKSQEQEDNQEAIIAINGETWRVQQGDTVQKGGLSLFVKDVKIDYEEHQSSELIDLETIEELTTEEIEELIANPPRSAPQQPAVSNIVLVVDSVRPEIEVAQGFALVENQQVQNVVEVEEQEPTQAEPVVDEVVEVVQETETSFFQRILSWLGF